MSGDQIAVVLDADLPLHDGQRQIAHDGRRCAKHAVDRGIEIIHLRKAEALVQEQRIQAQEHDVANDAADCTLHGLLRADDGCQLMFAAGAADKISAAVCDHGQQEGHQNIELAAVHAAQAHKRADEERIDEAAEQRHAHGREAQLRMSREQLAEQGAEIDEQAQQRAQPQRLLRDDAARTQPRPHDVRHSGDNRIGQNAAMLQDAGAPKHLIGRHAAGQCKQNRRCHRRQKQNDGQQQRKSDAGGKNAGQHIISLLQSGDRAR